MIKRIFVFFICLFLINICLFSRELSLYNREIEKFENYLSEYCINGKNGDEIYLVFDYEKIKIYLKEHIKEYDLQAYSESGFHLYINVKKGIFLKESKEIFYIRKGNLYDGSN